MDTQQLRDAHYHMHYEIPFTKLEDVTFRVITTVDVRPLDVVDFIEGGEDGWEDPTAHQQWITAASVEEIAGWAIAGLR